MQGDECRHVLDSIGIEVLQLDLVVVQQPPEKFVSRGSKPPLMEVRKQDDIVVGWRWHILLVTPQVFVTI